METRAKIYGIYLKYIAPEDIHVYSVDEVFIDATKYLSTYKLTVWRSFFDFKNNKYLVIFIDKFIV